MDLGRVRGSEGCGWGVESMEMNLLIGRGTRFVVYLNAGRKGLGKDSRWTDLEIATF